MFNRQKKADFDNLMKSASVSIDYFTSCAPVTLPSITEADLTSSLAKYTFPSIVASSVNVNPFAST